jgi:hypothetical protein
MPYESHVLCGDPLRRERFKGASAESANFGVTKGTQRRDANKENPG